MTAMTAPIRPKRGDWVIHVATGRLAQVVSATPGVLTLEADGQREFDHPSRWQRTVCEEMHP
jgi:hypothetical protein